MVPSVKPKMVMVGARVPPERRASIEARGDAYPNADGSRGNMSVVVREFLDLGEAMSDTARIRAVRPLAQAAGVSIGEMCARLVDRGLGLAAEPAPTADDPDELALDVTVADMERVAKLAKERGWSTSQAFRKILAAGLRALSAKGGV